MNLGPNSYSMKNQTYKKQLKLRALALSVVAIPTIALGQNSGANSDVYGRTIELEKLEVEGFRDSLELSREKMRAADNLQSIISADSVGKLPDANIAEALNRVTSVYLRPDQGEGRYVSIRGVDPILNNVTLNGQTIAVSDTDGRSGRAAPLDVLSASSVSSIEVHKVTLPDMDGQSIGGTINILAPSGFDYEKGYTRFNGEYGYNDFGSSNDIHAFGVDYGNTFGESNEWALFLSANYSFKEYLSHLYENPVADFPEEGEFADVLFPDRVRFGSAVGERERESFSANLEYQGSEDSKVWLRYYYTDYTDIELRPEFTIRNRGDIGATSASDFYWTRYRIENETRLEKQERPVDQLVLGGEQEITDSWTIEGNINLTNAKETNPYLNYYETETQTDSGTLDPNDAPVTFSLDRNGYATPVYNAAFSDELTPEDMAFHELSRLRNITSDVEEDTYTVDLNASWKGLWGDKPTVFKTGFKFLDRDKSVDDDDNRFPYEGDATLADAGLGTFFSDLGRGEGYQTVQGFSLPIPTPDAFEALRAANPSDFGFDESGSRSNSIEDDYTMNEKVLAYYAMATVELGSNVSITGGVRIEETDVDVSAFSFIDSVSTGNSLESNGLESLIDTLPFGESDIVDVSQSHSYTNVLPSIVLKWDINENWLFRSSVSTNIGRPDYPDTAPISTLEVTEALGEPGVFFADNSIGNPELKPFEGTNFDASLDYYFSDNSGVFSMGAFYKRIENAIYGFNEQFSDFEFAGVVFDEYQSSTIDNAEPGHISGLELTYQKDLVGLPEPFDGFGYVANVAFIDSEIEVSQRPGEKLPFFNQADLIYNAQVYYEKNRFSARLALAYQSEAIFDEISGSVEEDIYRAESTTLDAKVSYKIDENWSIYLTGKNLTDEPDLTYRNGSKFFVAENPGFERYGSEYRLGFTWRN